MPTWSLEELAVAAQRLQLPLSSAEIASRFAQAGGSARQVLEPEEDLEQVLKSAATGCTAVALLQVVRDSSDNEKDAFVELNKLALQYLEGTVAGGLCGVLVEALPRS